MKKIVELRNISKSFDGETVLDHINLEIQNREFITLLGPSGCGKTTLLNHVLNNKENFKVIAISLKNLPYQLIPFFLSMFVIVVGLNTQGITSHFASFLGNKYPIWVYGYTSFLSTNKDYL